MPQAVPKPRFWQKGIVLKYRGQTYTFTAKHFFKTHTWQSVHPATRLEKSVLKGKYKPVPMIFFRFPRPWQSLVPATNRPKAVFSAKKRSSKYSGQSYIFTTKHSFKTHTWQSVHPATRLEKSVLSENDKSVPIIFSRFPRPWQSLASATSAGKLAPFQRIHFAYIYGKC
jgi:hypothetical protein